MFQRKTTKTVETPPAPSKPAGEGVWEAPGISSLYREETREFEDLTFTVVRRSLTFPEETHILQRVIDPNTKRPDMLELLALTVEKTVKSNDFGLTAKRVREFLPERPNLAWFLIKWLCEETSINISPNKMEDLRKKSGP